MSVPSVGQNCPDFELPESDGQLVSKASLKGRPFVLYFYPKDDTSGCTTEAIEFTALIEAFAALGVEVFGVSPDSVSKHCRFRDKHGLKVGLLADEEKTLLQAFGVWVEKSMYGRKYLGVERTTALIDREGKIAKVWEKVKAGGHAKEVLDVAKALKDSEA
ncbi:peroxiredoxin [Aureimonas sp. AU40]|uniref:peroxiredoxin n=1 Tax=Aureimonas sp. AU40 TaxID=1637747 RepID=UPI000784CD50|nr:peroxiredoxin [Aureimonas sp. AU40]